MACLGVPSRGRAPGFPTVAWLLSPERWCGRLVDRLLIEPVVRKFIGLIAVPWRRRHGDDLKSYDGAHDHIQCAVSRK
jgi:hypothetical protein